MFLKRRNHVIKGELQRVRFRFEDVKREGPEWEKEKLPSKSSHTYIRPERE